MELLRSAFDHDILLQDVPSPSYLPSNAMVKSDCDHDGKPVLASHACLAFSH